MALSALVDLLTCDWTDYLKRFSISIHDSVFFPTYYSQYKRTSKTEFPVNRCQREQMGDQLFLLFSKCINNSV